MAGLWPYVTARHVALEHFGGHLFSDLGIYDRDPNIDPQIVGSPYSKEPNKVPPIS